MRPSLTRVEILLWLLPAALATGIAMAVAGWLGRERAEDRSPAQNQTPDQASRPAQQPVPDTELLGHPGEGVSPPRTAKGVHEPHQPHQPHQADHGDERPAPGQQAPPRRTA